MRNKTAKPASGCGGFPRAARLAAAGLMLLMPILTAGLARAWEPDLNWGGRFKTLDLVLEPGPEGWSEGGELSANSLRLTLGCNLPNEMTLDVALETGLLATNPAGLTQFGDDGGQRLLDLTATWGEGNTVSGQLQVDRLSLSGRSDRLEWTLGRQAIGFGRILLFSPLDVIAPFAPDAIDTEIRPGVDALKVRGYFGQTGEIGAYAILADHFEDSSGLATFSWNTGGVDILGIAGSLRERPMAGFGLAGDLGGLGLKAEVVAYDGVQVSRPGGDLHAWFAIAAVEGWYRFGNGLVLTGQYLYNGAGADRPADYLLALDSAPVREGLSYLLGQHYLLLAPSYEIHPLATLSGMLIWNLQDLSCLLRPAITISLSDNTSLMVFWAVHTGHAPQNRFIARSEFGTRGDGGGIFLAWHF